MSVVENKIPVWISQLEKIVNKTLSLDEETLCKLEKLRVKWLHLNLLIQS